VLGIDVIDTYAAFLLDPTWATDYMADNIHTNATGANIIRDRIKAAFDAS
jgi:lysophospholipase L1-like esterase